MGIDKNDDIDKIPHQCPKRSRCLLVYGANMFEQQTEWPASRSWPNVKRAIQQRGDTSQTV
jgi:hypothetical protein